MKRFLLIIAAGGAGLLAPWLLFSFTMWDLNPANWTDASRFVAGFLGMMLAPMVAVAAGQFA